MSVFSRQSISRDGLDRKARKPCNQGADLERKAGP
jgi:hypothetical protein